jgi:D-amino peptidase
VVLVTGDAAAVAELQAVIGPIEAAVVKWPVSFHSARTLTPQAAARLIEERARAALVNRRARTPYVLRGPVTLDVTFKHYQPSQLLSWLPGVERPTAHSIRYVGPDILAVSRFLAVINNYSLDLEP